MYNIEMLCFPISSCNDSLYYLKCLNSCFLPIRVNFIIPLFFFSIIFYLFVHEFLKMAVHLVSRKRKKSLNVNTIASRNNFKLWWGWYFIEFYILDRFRYLYFNSKYHLKNKIECCLPLPIIFIHPDYFL